MMVIIGFSIGIMFYLWGPYPNGRMVFVRNQEVGGSRNEYTSSGEKTFLGNLITVFKY